MALRRRPDLLWWHALERLPKRRPERSHDAELGRLGPEALDHDRAAYVSGMDRMLWVAAAISVAGAVLAAAAMAGQGGRLEPEGAGFEHERDSVA